MHPLCVRFLYIHYLHMQAFHLLTMLTQDSMGLILRELEIIIMEKMHFMKDTPRVQASDVHYCTQWIICIV